MAYLSDIEIAQSCKMKPISEIAEVIINKKINRIPIVNEILEVVGIVSRHDIVRSMVMEADAAENEDFDE